MAEKTTLEIQCPECSGTGIYSGMFEKTGQGVLCNECKGTGKKRFSYTPFSGRETSHDHLTVFPDERSDIGKTVKTTKLDQEYDQDFNPIERSAQCWDIVGTIYDTRVSPSGKTQHLVAHREGGMAWYGLFETDNRR